jgi:hypothetical protein
MDPEQKTITDLDIRYLTILTDFHKYEHLDSYIEQFLVDKGFYRVTYVLSKKKATIDYTVIYILQRSPKLREYVKKLYAVYAEIYINPNNVHIDLPELLFLISDEMNTVKKISDIQKDFLQDDEFHDFIDLFNMIDIFAYFLRPTVLFYRNYDPKVLSTYPCYRYAINKNRYPIIRMMPVYTRYEPLYMRELTREYSNKIYHLGHVDTVNNFYVNLIDINGLKHVDIKNRVSDIEYKMSVLGYRIRCVQVQ